MVAPNVIFQMKKSLLKFVKSKKLTQESYEYEHPYDPNVLQFNRGMQNPTMTSSGKRKYPNG